eukprot:TRINITY_DN23658_c0_g1_i1.p1 TRINITY_DN23658_c0_g1~~TRINITY_DN23658_c0_g1_i1.p1  ORF type:complete len:343 (-),score=61.60 TRINITY_DN23658_c0_g1_i1:93-1121(-)
MAAVGVSDMMPSAIKAPVLKSLPDLRKRKPVLLEVTRKAEKEGTPVTRLAPSPLQKTSRTEDALPRSRLSSLSDATAVSSESSVVVAGSAGLALRRALGKQAQQRVVRSSSSSLIRPGPGLPGPALEPLEMPVRKQRPMARRNSDANISSTLARSSQLASSPSKRRSLTGSSSEAGQRCLTLLRSSSKPTPGSAQTPKVPKAGEEHTTATSPASSNEAKLDARKIGLSRLMYKCARGYHQSRSSFQARSQGTAERHPGTILREVLTDIRLAVRTVGHLNHFLELLEERQEENIKNRSTASTWCTARSDSKCSVRTEISSLDADDAWNNLLTGLSDDSDSGED